MQVLCVASNDDRADVVCPVCDQRYAIYFSRQDQVECERALASVSAALVAHHEHDSSPSAHPADVFNVPAWHGVAHMSAAALLSGAPVRMAPASRERLVS